MTRARRPLRCSLVLACVLSSACDEDPGVEEVDRGAKPIESRRADLERFGLSPTGIAGAHVEIVDIQLLATGTIDDEPLAMITSEDGTPVCAVVGSGTSMRWADVDALAEGRLELLSARPSDVDADAAAVLEHLAAR